MRTLRIRTFMILIFFIVLSVPWDFILAARFLETKTLSFAKSGAQDEMQQRHLAEITHLIETNPDQWRDPDWQIQLQKELREAKMDAAILSEADQEIFRSNPERAGSLSSTERFSVIEDGHLLGKVVIYLPKSNTVQMISAFAGLLFAFLIIGMAMRRLLLKPLERMGFAARQIAAGDWDVKLAFIQDHRDLGSTRRIRSDGKRAPAIFFANKRNWRRNVDL
ncbi:hypothetical protein LJK88_42390 [Paenibacillus sp. P26]|nr:hypothetical protein LJK88_42390 [Paenibacillus sp. P26]